jgi:chorismate synthase
MKREREEERDRNQAQRCHPCLSIRTVKVYVDNTVTATLWTCVLERACKHSTGIQKEKEKNRYSESLRLD